LLALDGREQQNHGEALGTIIAIIITHHMVNTSAALSLSKSSNRRDACDAARVNLG
jgi:hypothetical protein